MKILSFITRNLRPLLLLAALSVAGCEADYELELPLAVNDDALNLKKTEGSTRVLVYSTGSWNASFETDTPWAVIENPEGSGNGEFILRWQANPGIDRTTTVRIAAGERVQTIEVVQKGEIDAVDLELLEETRTHIAWSGRGTVPLRTNLSATLELIEIGVEYLDAEGVAVQTEPWISDVVLGEEALTYACAENASGSERFARLTLAVEDAVNGRTYSTSTLIVQTAEGGSLSFDEELLTIGSFGKTYRAEWNCNVASYLEQIRSEVAYEPGVEPWLDHIVATEDALLFDAAENASDRERRATIRLTLTHADQTLRASLVIVQTRPEKTYTLAELRDLLPAAGRLSLTGDSVEGVVVGQAGNANMGLNPFLDWNRIDFTVNDATNYLQSADGRYGLRIRARDAESNRMLERYATVKLSLAGTTLVREDNPVRYTLEGFDAQTDLIESTPGTPASVVEKRRGIAELTDDDIYTYVILKEVEFAVDFQSFGNFWEVMGLKTALTVQGASATQARCDCVPRLLRDRENRTLHMLVNSQTPWRCFGSDVPHGSGDVAGIVVHCVSSQYGPIGTYQIRPLAREDIRLSESNDSGFSRKLATWYYPLGATQYPGGKSIQRLLSRADFSADREAFMDNSVKGKWNQSPILSALSFDDAGSKSIRTSSPATGWWNATLRTGEYVYWKFSTAQVPAGSRLTLAFTAALGNNNVSKDTYYNPLYWKVLCSTDGTNFTEVTQVAVYPAPDQQLEYRSDKLPAGLKEFLIELPEEAIGRSEVVVRLQAASDTAIDPRTGEPTAKAKAVAAYMRFGAVVVKYNQ